MAEHAKFLCVPIFGPTWGLAHTEFSTTEGDETLHMRVTRISLDDNYTKLDYFVEGMSCIQSLFFDFPPSTETPKPLTKSTKLAMKYRDHVKKMKGMSEVCVMCVMYCNVLLSCV